MAETLINVQLKTSQLAATVAHRLNRPASHRHQGVNALIREFERALGGSRDAEVICSVESTTNTTKASMTITITHANIATDKVTIGGVDFVEATDFEDGADAGEAADNLAAAINADTSLQGIVDATSDGTDTVTLTATTAGRWGNLITVTTDDATGFTLSSATLTGATTAESVAPVTWSLGL